MIIAVLAFSVLASFVRKVQEQTSIVQPAASHLYFVIAVIKLHFFWIKSSFNKHRDTINNLKEKVNNNNNNNNNSDNQNSNRETLLYGSASAGTLTLDMNNIKGASNIHGGRYTIYGNGNGGGHDTDANGEETNRLRYFVNL